MDRVRRSSCLLLVIILLTLFPSSALPAYAGPADRRSDQHEAPPVIPQIPTTPTYPSRPGLALTVTAAPEAVTVGSTATITLTLTNRAVHAAEQVIITLPTPDGTTPLAGDGLVSAGAGWQWSIDRLAGNDTITRQAQVRVNRMPQGAALLAHPQATARDLAETAHVVGGVRVAARETGPKPTRFTPGRAARVSSEDGHVTVQLPAQASRRALTLRASHAPQADAPSSATRPGWKRGWDTVFLTATDDAGVDVHTFDAPITIAMSYTPEQLQALGTTEADLVIFWFDEAQQRWVPQPTTVDPATKTASITVDHFSAFQLSDGSSPSEAYIPSLQGFQVSQFTGAASYSIPIDVPAGAGGLKPAIQLSYSSASTDGTGGARDAWQASWVGKGWSLEPGGSVSVNKSLAGDGWNHYSFVFGGRSFDAVRGQLLPPYIGGDYGDQNLAHWSWHPVDEDFSRVRAEEVGNGSYRWRIWDKSGTRYTFTEPLLTTDSQTSYVYKWLLTETTDVHGNRIVYDYQVDQINAYHPTYRLKAILWGYDGATPGTGTARYKVEFDAGSRWASGTEQVDLNWEYPTCSTCGTYWSTFTPHEAYRLNAIKVLSMKPGAASYELVRQYQLSYAASTASVRSDRSSGQRVLTLTAVQKTGKNVTSVLPATTFSYVPSGQTGENRLNTINNGQGGQIQFTYEPVWATTPTGECACLYQNFYRIANVRHIESAVNPGAPTTTLTTYEYQGAALNNSTNAASIVYAMYPPSGNGDSRAFLARQEKREFRGHAWVVERKYNGATTGAPVLSMQYQWFYQGLVTDNNKPNCSIQHSNDLLVEDTCFQQMVEHESWKGRAYQEETRAPDGITVLARTRHIFVREPLPFFGSDSSVPNSVGLSNNYKRAGLWRAFAYERQTINEAVEGSATPVTTTASYSYEPALQGGKQYGNLTTTEEYINGSAAAERVTQRYYTIRDDASNYLVDRVWQEAVKDGQARFLALTAFFYDGGTTAPTIGTRGLVTQTRKYYNVPLQTSLTNVTLHSGDASYTYDAYGNRITETTYAQPGTRVYNGSSTTYSTPGSGSAARTVTTSYDNTFHAFAVQSTPPTVNGVTLTEQAEYDYRMGTLTKIIDANNIATMAEYDDFGRMVKLIKHGDSSAYPTVEALYYDFEQPFRYVQRQREVSGQPGYRSTQTFYNGLGRKIQTKRESQDLSQNIVTDTRFDVAGNPVQESQPRYVNETGSSFGSYTAPTSSVLWTTTSYDALGRPLQATQPDGKTERHRYFLQSGLQLDDFVDANRHRTITRSDALGRRVRVDEYAGECNNTVANSTCVAPFTTAWTLAGTTTYRYTPLDLLDQVVDANNNITGIGYDSLGRKTIMSDPDMGIWSYQYDTTGNLLRQTDAKGQTTVFQYDPLNRLTAKTSPDGRVSYYGYDEAFTFGKGKRTSMSLYVNGVQQSYSSFYYDERGRNINRGNLVVGMSSARHIAWTYDTADRVTSILYPSNETVTYTYDQAWRQTSVCSSLGGCYANNAQYTALDQPLSLTFGNGLPQTWVYTNPMQELYETYVGSSTSNVLSRRFSYDNVGNLTQVEDRTIVPSQTHTYTYDHRDRLTGVAGPVDNDSYSYDAIGNLLSKGGQSYTYSVFQDNQVVGPHQVRNKGGWTYTYDNNGNLTGHNGRTYTWNSDNLPSRIVIPNIADESYTYDADGERLTRTVNGVTTVYLSGVWEEEIQTGLSYSHYSLQGRAVAQRTNTPNEVLYLHSDHLGSVSAVTSYNQLIVSKQDFTPWGEIRGGSSGITQTSLDFTGQKRDSTGILYYHARYYDPNLGRFLSADSVVPGAPDGSMDGVALKPLTVDFHEIGFATGLKKENNQSFWFQMDQRQRQEVAAPWGPLNAQALNRYSYVQNNPLGYTDPSGHAGIDVDDNEKDFMGQTQLDRLIDFFDELFNHFSISGAGFAAIMTFGAAATAVAGPVGLVLSGLAAVAITGVVMVISKEIYRVLTMLKKAKTFLSAHGGGTVGFRIDSDGRTSVKAYSNDGYAFKQYTRVVYGSFFVMGNGIDRFYYTDKPARLSRAARRRNV